MQYCTKCVSPSSRPRLEFDANGVCSACSYHADVLTKIDWPAKWNELIEICDRFRRHDGSFDCICPCSGGKDGSYVAWRLKHDLGMHPLCVTFRPHLRSWIGSRNLENFKDSGFDHMEITPNADQYKKFARDALITKGMPKQPFVVGISTAVLKIAELFNIDLVIWGENGEVVYGGNRERGQIERFKRDFLIDIYYEGQGDSDKYGLWWQIPSQEVLDRIYSTWWSFYEDWDPEHHAKHAKNHCGFEMLVGGSIGTFTNYAQMDDTLQDLHCYLQFLKFGFGRCTSDASIEIRRGRMTREQGVEVVRKLDGTYPLEYEPAYLSYFEMSKDEFWNVLDSWANKDLLVKDGPPERPWRLRVPCA